MAHTASTPPNEQGSTIVEMAIVLPLLILTIIGIIEIGLAFKDYLTVSAASREGARIAALAGTNSQADCAVLIGINDLVSDGDIDRIDRIEIYKAAEGTGAQGVTNVAVVNAGDDQSVCTQPHGITDGWTINPVAYPPAVRQTTVGTTNLDIVGVRVIMTRSWITNFPPFAGTATLDETTITRLEPEAFAP